MTIDADAHIEESEAMFERLDQEFRPRRPLPVKLDRDTVYGRDNAVWLIDGETYPNSRKPRTLVSSASSMGAERSEKARCRNSDTHVIGESDGSIVPRKLANKGWVPRPAESVEGRGLTKENTEQLLPDRT